MNKLEGIADQIRQSFDARTLARDKALAQARSLTRACALSIRAVHRDEPDVVRVHLDEAHQLADALRNELAEFPDLFFTGYTQDALKEFAEASITCALICHQSLPTVEQLELPPATYLNGLAESIGEMRRRCLDMLRQGNSSEAELMLGHMEEIFSILVTMDYPDAITNGLRRQTDVARAIIERTRGDITFSLRSEQLAQSLSQLSAKIPGDQSLPGIPPLAPPPEE